MRPDWEFAKVLILQRYRVAMRHKDTAEMEWLGQEVRQVREEENRSR